MSRSQVMQKIRWDAALGSLLIGSSSLLSGGGRSATFTSFQCLSACPSFPVDGISVRIRPFFLIFIFIFTDENFFVFS
jgi:hypothetical protein